MKDKQIVLIAEPDEGSRALLGQLIQSYGCDALLATRSEEAMSVLRERAVDLVIADMTLSGDCGTALLRQMRSEFRNIPVIIVTSRPAVDAAVECIKNGAAEYLTKPFDHDKLRACVDKILQECRSRLEQEESVGKIQSLYRREIRGYNIKKLIGAGTMGAVFLAEKNDTAEKVAIKLWHCQAASGPSRDRQLARFVNEARIAAMCEHPNIVSIVEYGYTELDNIPYIVMNYLNGKTLRELSRGDYVFPMDRKIAILRQIADALYCIHSHNICHRDVKPQNIIVSPKAHATLTDFGIARDPEFDLTKTNEFLGSVAYLSPEAFLSPKVDFKSDIFALGIVAYELCSGTHPFSSIDLRDLADMIQFEDPVPPSEVAEEISPELEAVLLKMLEKHPLDRHESALQVSEELAACIGSAG